MFLAGNWEGDWALMWAGGCRQGGKYNMSCDIPQAVLDRAVAWGTARQEAISEAMAETQSSATVLYYIEYTFGTENRAGKPGMVNSVVPAVNPDLVSFSAYKVARSRTRHCHLRAPLAHAACAHSRLLALAGC